MPAFTLKNIPEDLYARLKTEAKANRRSINSEILTCLDTALRSQRVDPETFLARADRYRLRPRTPLTDEALEAAIEDGRP